MPIPAAAVQACIQDIRLSSQAHLGPSSCGFHPAVPGIALLYCAAVPYLLISWDHCHGLSCFLDFAAVLRDLSCGICPPRACICILCRNIFRHCIFHADLCDCLPQSRWKWLVTLLETAAVPYPPETENEYVCMLG